MSTKASLANERLQLQLLLKTQDGVLHEQFSFVVTDSGVSTTLIAPHGHFCHSSSTIKKISGTDLSYPQGHKGLSFLPLFFLSHSAPINGRVTEYFLFEGGL